MITIILIDDHDIIREGLASMIQTQPDMKLMGTAADPERGYELIIEHSPRIVVTDISMPSGAPFSAIEQARDKVGDTRFIFFTAHATDTNLQRAIECNGEGFISKGEPILTVLEAIREVARGGTFYSDEMHDRMVQARAGAENEVVTRRTLLSKRETEVLKLVARGLTAKQISAELNISSKTVDRHKANIMAKLQMHSQVDLTRYAIREQLIEP